MTDVVIERRKRVRRQLDAKLFAPDTRLTTRDVAEQIGYAPGTIHNLVRAGKFPKPDFPGASQNWWHWATVSAWIAAQKLKVS